jgi:hypothetical protein
MTTIKLKNGSGAPTAGDLVQGEPALDLTNKRLYTEDSGGTVIEVGTNPGTDVTFADNRKAIFGAGSDLQIYHDGSNSYITDSGTGNLRISGTLLQLNDASFNKYLLGSGDSVTLYNADSAKLQTTSTGIDVTGEVKGDSLEIGTAFDGATVEITSAVTDFTLGSVTTGADLLFSYNRGSGTTTISEGTRGSETALQQWAGNGDISFYNSAGTSQDLYWDASTSRLGLGTTSPSSALTVAVDDATGDNGARIAGVTDGNKQLRLAYNTTGNYANIQAIHAGTAYTNLVLQKDGGNVGIGTASPSYLVDAQSSGDASIRIRSTGTGASDDSLLRMQIAGTTASNIIAFGDSDSSFAGEIRYTHNNNSMSFDTNGSEAMRINSSGNVGIGTASPAFSDGSGLRIERASTATLRLQDTGAHGFEIRATASAGEFFSANSKPFTFITGDSERLRIDSSGNVLVGKTAIGSTTDGFEARASGYTALSDTSGAALNVNRNSTDGNLVTFTKDGTTVGSIGSYLGAYAYIGSTGGTDTHIGFVNGTVRPATATGAGLDATLDLGNSSSRFKDLYLSGGAYLGGTASANHLDDYEEGTFTPTLYGASSAGTTTYATVTGNYTKVGNRCTVNFVCSVTATTGTGSLRLGGLPFSSSGENTTAIMVNNLNWGGGTYLMAYVGDNNTFARVYYLGDDNTWQQQQITNEAQHFIFTLTYQTA